MRQSNETISKLANAQLGAIEKLLLIVRNKILKDCNRERDMMYFHYDDEGKGGLTNFFMSPAINYKFNNYQCVVIFALFFF